MDVADFMALLDRAGLDLSPTEVCETLWLAQYATPPPAEPSAELSAELSAGTGHERDSPGSAGAVTDTPDLPEPERARRVPLYLPAVGAGVLSGTGAAGQRVRMPASTALPGSLDLMRGRGPAERGR